MTRRELVLVTAILGAGAFAACSKTTPEPERGSSPAATTTTAAAGPSGGGATPPANAAAAGPDEIAWEAPKTWVSVPNTNTMRKATYKIPKVDGDSEDAELTVSAAAGGVEQNVKRWAGQFGNAEPKTEQRSPNGLKVTLVEIKGTYASGGMMGAPATPKDKFMLLGAVVDGGDRQHFFKMTGPEKTVTAAKKDFDAFVASFHGK